MDDNNIEYYIKTDNVNGNAVISRNSDLKASSGMLYGMNIDSMNSNGYTIFVKRKNFIRAKELN